MIIGNFSGLYPSYPMYTNSVYSSTNPAAEDETNPNAIEHSAEPDKVKSLENAPHQRTVKPVPTANIKMVLTRMSPSKQRHIFRRNPQVQECARTKENMSPMHTKKLLKKMEKY